MTWDPLKFVQREEKDFRNVRDEIVKRGNGFFDSRMIKRAVSVWHDQTLCGYFLTCETLGIQSFHGYKYISGAMVTQMEMTRKYIEDEKLEFSSYTSPKTGALLKAIGFKDFVVLNEVHIARKI